jgi:ATP-binding cassette subfamily B protein
VRDILKTLAFLFSLSWSTSRARLIRGGALLLLGSIATPLISLALKGLINAILGSHTSDAISWGVVVAAVLVGEVMLGHFAHLYYFELSEIDEIELNRRLLRIVNGSPTLDRCDDPGFADGVDLLRHDIFKMRETVQSALQLVCLAVQTVMTAVVLASVDPLLLLLPLTALLPVVLGRRAQRFVDVARTASAQTSRSARHLRTLASAPEALKEIRTSGSCDYILMRHDSLYSDHGRLVSRGQMLSAALRAGGQLAFGAAYVGSVMLVFIQAARGHATVGDVILVITLASQTSSQVTSGLGLLTTVYAAADGIRRFEGLAAAAAIDTGTAQTFGIDSLRDGIEFEGVRFAYPGTDKEVIRGLDLHLPAGTSVAIVGENGAGKSTLIKLLAGLYVPTSGRILVDGTEMTSRTAASWCGRTSTLFQDFARLDFVLRESVGVGDLDDIDDAEAVSSALARARADAVIERVGHDLESLIGHGYGDGAELSGGQWQSVGLARTLMRRRPVLLSLDEPASALDPEAEQLMCDTYQKTARDVAMDVGGVTIFVTHRLSTVKLADLIVVLDGGRAVEIGTHEDLVASGGRYAGLFALQSRAYS